MEPAKKPIKHRVIDRILEILENSPSGERFEVIVEAVLETLPEANRGSVGNWLYGLHLKHPDKVVKPARGLYVHAKYKSDDEAVTKAAVAPQHSIKEEDFYKAFADYLVKDLEECTKAIPLGGNKLGNKWGTPDVIGKWQSAASHIIKVPTEIVSAEVKIETSQLITAFGQACAYRLFSHKVYLVIPKSAGAIDVARLEALCLILGIGLVLFDKDNKDEPNFEIRVRSILHQPDNFYLNESIAAVEGELFA